MRDDHCQAEDQDHDRDLRSQPLARGLRDDDGVADRRETPQTQRSDHGEGRQRERRVEELRGEELDPALGLDGDDHDQRQHRDREDGRGPSPMNVELTQTREHE